MSNFDTVGDYRACHSDDCDLVIKKSELDISCTTLHLKKLKSRWLSLGVTQNLLVDQLKFPTAAEHGVGRGGKIVLRRIVKH